MKKWQAVTGTVMHSLCTVSVTVHCRAQPAHSVTVHCYAQPVQSVLLCTVVHSLCTVSVTVHYHAQPVHNQYYCALSCTACTQYYCALSCTACAQSVLLCTIMHNLCTVSVTVHLLTETRTSAASSSHRTGTHLKRREHKSQCGQYRRNSHPVHVK